MFGRKRVTKSTKIVAGTKGSHKCDVDDRNVREDF